MAGIIREQQQQWRDQVSHQLRTNPQTGRLEVFDADLAARKAQNDAHYKAERLRIEQEQIEALARSNAEVQAIAEAYDKVIAGMNPATVAMIVKEPSKSMQAGISPALARYIYNKAAAQYGDATEAGHRRMVEAMIRERAI